MVFFNECVVINVLKRNIFIFLNITSLVLAMFFIGLVKAEAKTCSCFYTFSVDSTNASSVETNQKQFFQIDYTETSAKVARACGNSLIGDATGDTLITLIKKKCPAPSGDPIDRSNFNVNTKSIVDNCSVESCASANLLFDATPTVLKITQKASSNTGPLTSISEENWERAEEIAEDRQEGANNYIDDIDPNDIVSSTPEVEEKEKIGDTCDIIPPSIITFLKNLFLIIQVLGIILLIVMSMIEFIKAITGSDDDTLRKAIKNIFRRIIIVVILLILPTLIIWVLNIVNNNAYETDAQGKRIIGENGDPLCKVERNSSANNSSSNTSSQTKPSGNKTTKLVTSIKLNKTSVSLVVGDTVKLKTTITPSNAANKKVTWKSNNK